MRLSVPLTGLLILLAPQTSLAQQTPPARLAEPVDGRIGEYFDRSGSADVSGGMIVGALLGGMASTFPPDHIWIATPSERVTLCLQALSRDGFYSARTRYQLTGVTDGMAGTRLMPFTRLSDSLRGYDDDEVAIIATAADDQGQCRSGDARLFPRVQPDLGPGEAEMLLQLNAAGRSAAWIVTQDGERTDCQPVNDNLAIGFDMTCSLRVPVETAASTLDLVLWVDDGLQPEPTSYRLEIPGYEEQG